jgi:hypothetical protein
MLFRVIFYSILFFILIRIINIIGRLISGSSRQSNINNAGNGQKKKTYSKDEIEEADYEEIK